MSFIQKSSRSDISGLTGHTAKFALEMRGNLSVNHADGQGVIQCTTLMAVRVSLRNLPQSGLPPDAHENGWSSQ
jgi:hypothetical protein